MTHNITAHPGTEPTPAIPCKTLVALLGWAMELYHRIEAEDLRHFNDYFYESFILSYHSDDQERRAQAYLFHKEVEELCNTFAGIDSQEARALNRYLLHICNQEIKKQAL